MPDFVLFRRHVAEENVLSDMRSVELYFVTCSRAQYNLFKQTVRGLLGRGRTKPVGIIVSDVKDAIVAHGHIVVGDPKTYARRDAQVETLRDGLAKLDTIQQRHSSTEEESAIKEDTAKFQKAFGLLPDPKQSCILVHDMVDPLALPREMRGLSTCKEARRYLMSKGVRHPELWERKQDSLLHSPNKLMWHWLRLDEEIHEKHLEYVNRFGRNGDYIVVLKCESQNELPQPIDIARLGDPCCTSNCRNLQAHLQSLWTPQIVTRARTIKDGADMLTETFDTSVFDPRTNDLCVYVE